MSTLARGLGIGLSAVALTSLGAGAAREIVAHDATHARRSPARRAPPAGGAAPCPPHMLPDDSVCVRWPEDDFAAREKNGDAVSRWGDDDEIPRRPDRPLDYQAYRYPVPCSSCVVVEDEQSALDRRPDRLAGAGRGGIDLTVRGGTPVTALSLENQNGPTKLLYVGDLLGSTVITAHSVSEAGGERDYVVVLGHLDSTASDLPRVSTGAPPIALPDGRPLGWVGDRRSLRLSHLHLEVRRVRKGIDVRALRPSALIDPASTIACDPRNVLPLK